MKAAVLATLLGLLAFPSAGAAEVFTISGTVDEAWEPVFHLFPVEGTGSSAVGTVSFEYDTETNLATDFAVSIQGLSVAELDPNPGRRLHVHAPGGALILIDIGVLGFVDVPGGIALSSDADAFVFESLEKFLLDGTAWANVHTIAFPSGEIAGTVHGPNLIPFPPWSWAVASLLVALLGVFFLRSLRTA